ncbi:Tn3 family transposase [Hymenobacter arizonensis]|uniref:Tn3 family transposase n=1 Tax=Hymenobacter arizonensis TaxID=1227077 RepID=UPI001160316E|nr:Tn3 family transposase [Hymenobacter arizonensis]
MTNRVSYSGHKFFTASRLNKGEQLHALRNWLWFRGDGVLRRKQGEPQQEVMRCLNEVTNVVVWNTV